MTPDGKAPDARLRVVASDEWELWRAIRLEALAEAPDAFASRLADWSDAPEERWRARLELDGSHNLVAMHGDTAVGMVSGLPGKKRDIVWLLSMYVSPVARHRGVASLLVDAVERWAVRRGAEALWLEVVAANRPAVRLYERHGLVVVGEVPSDDPGDPLELYMSKPLRTR